MNPLLVYVIPAIVFLWLFIQWRRYGRDPQKRKDILLKYSPPKGLTPAEAGVLIDEYADTQDIMATFFDLAARRHFMIEDLSEGVKLTLIQDYEDDTGLEKYEKALMKSIFGRKESAMLSEVKDQLKDDFANIKQKLYETVAEKGFFEKNPEYARSDYQRLAALLLLLAILAAVSKIQFAAGTLLWSLLGHGVFALTFTGLLFLVFAKVMPKKTKRGQALYEDLLGMKKFLRDPVDAEGRYEGYADEKTYFEKLLPYAIVFDEAQNWFSSNVYLYQQHPPRYARTKKNFLNFFTEIQDMLS